jgi:hypothetical protein
LKKLPWVQFIDAVPEVAVRVIGWLVNEPVTVKLPVIIDEPV